MNWKVIAFAALGLADHNGYRMFHQKMDARYRGSPMSL